MLHKLFLTVWSSITLKVHFVSTYLIYEIFVLLIVSYNKNKLKTLGYNMYFDLHI